MYVQVYAKGTNGLPTTTLVDEFTPNDLSFTHASLWGPLSATISYAGTRDEAFTIAQDWLGNEVKLFSDDGDWLWEGLIWTISFTYGRRSRRRSLEGYANWVRVHYQVADLSTDPPTNSGTTSHVSATDTAQSAVYGQIEHKIDAGPQNFATATAIANAELARRTRMLWLPESGTLGTDTGDEARIEIECYGWYRTLWYMPVFVVTTATGSLDTGAYIAELISPPSLAPFISANDDYFATTGVDAEGSWLPGTTLGEIIKELVERAEGYTFRLDRDRVPVLEADKRLATTPDYLEDVYGALTNSAGQPVPLWAVRSDTVIRQSDFVPVGAFSDAEVDKISAVYLAEVSWRMPGELSFQTSVAGERGDVDA
jgi:hypothetical protein